MTTTTREAIGEALILAVAVALGLLALHLAPVIDGAITWSTR